MKKIKIIFRYILYYVRAKTKHSVHSPFVYSLVCDVINKKKKNEKYRAIEALRQKLLRDNTLLEIEDFGAVANKNRIKTIKSIARNSAKSSKYAQLLFRLVNYFKPQHILELGTSLGISTCYMSLAAPQSKIITIEGSSNIAEKAKQNFQSLGINNIDVCIGNFDVVLPEVLKEMNHLDFVFFDGNHQKQATIEYFKQCLQYSNDKSVFVFDDIHWSKGMQEAWQYIRNHQRVKVSIDLFFIGLVFFDNRLSRQHFTVRF